MQLIKSIFSPAGQEFMNGCHSGRGSGGGPVPLWSGNSIKFRGSCLVFSPELYLGGQVDISFLLSENLTVRFAYLLSDHLYKVP